MYGWETARRKAASGEHAPTGIHGKRMYCTCIYGVRYAKVFLCFPPPPAESAQLILMSKKWGKSRRGVAPSYIESGDHLPPSAFFYRASPLSTHGICSVRRGGGGERRRAPALTVGEKGGAGVDDGGQESISGWRRTRQRLGSVRRSGAGPID